MTQIGLAASYLFLRESLEDGLHAAKVVVLVAGEEMDVYYLYLFHATVFLMLYECYMAFSSCRFCNGFPYTLRLFLSARPCISPSCGCRGDKGLGLPGGYRLHDFCRKRIGLLSMLTGIRLCGRSTNGAVCRGIRREWRGFGMI